MKKITKKDLLANFKNKLSGYFGVELKEATKEQIYKGATLTIKDILNTKRTEYNNEVKKCSAKKVYYLCLEFLVGRQLKNNLMNLGIYNMFSSLLKETSFSIDEIIECENDPGLGNGGLGRLAACYMDSMTSLDYPVTGFSICYEYGLFKQRLIDGEQVELPDVWLPSGEVWLEPRSDRTYTVRFGGKIREIWRPDGRYEIIHEEYDEVQALPYDLLISGADSDAVNNLRLWRAHNNTNFNMNLFSQGQYVKAMEERTNAEIISKVLYPSDNHTEGKLLRLSQQYFLVSASLQSIITDHLRKFGSLDNFKDKVAIHINDTHPALVIPELMRLLLDVYSYSWEDAWHIVTNTVSYTNHTVLPEALECWGEDLFKLKLPRLHMIVSEINRRLCENLWSLYPGDWERISNMAILASGQVRMANLSVTASHMVNGVSKLHTNILKETVFHDFYKYAPQKFINITNGIAHRRWLCYSNPKLASLLDECIGADYRTKPEKLLEFMKYADDTSVLEKIEKIKNSNKIRFADYAKRKCGVIIDPNSFFDVQIKRMHEYKRQLLNALKIMALYIELKENPSLDMHPQTFIFGAKAANGYYMAKRIIKLIYSLSREIASDPAVNCKLNVVFMEDYNVSMAEVLIPAAELSEQISLAGKEASGTSNMKLMINGALTIGTRDGANIEIIDAVGEENGYMFGLNAAEADELWQKGYHSAEFCNRNLMLRKIMDLLQKGLDGESYSEFVNYLVMGTGISDPYMCLADFDSYIKTYKDALKDYQDRETWSKKSLINISSSGVFAADRSIREYAELIWKVKPVKLYEGI